MTKDGKMLALAAVVVMIAASLACVVPMVSDSDSYATETTGNIVNISVGQVKQSIIAVNETAFEFDSKEDDDGIVSVTGEGDVRSIRREAMECTNSFSNGSLC